MNRSTKNLLNKLQNDDNIHAAEEISASMIELSNIANNTKNKVSEFKLDNESEINNPLNNHKESNPESK